MQFNYNTGGLNVDITDALNIRKQRMAEKDANREAEQSKRLRELNTQINETLSSNPSADVSSLYREMAGIDRTAAKEYQQMNAEMDIEQQRSLFDTVKEMKMYEQMGRGDLAEKTVSERLNLLEQYKGNSNHTKLLKSIYENPNLDEDQRIKKLDAITQYGIQKGVIKPPPSKDLKHLGQRVDSEGKYYDAIQNMVTGEIDRHYSGDTRQKQLDAETKKIQSRAGGRGIELTKEDAVTVKENNDNAKADRTLADRALKLSKEYGALYEQSKNNRMSAFTDSGYPAKFVDAIKKFAGEQDPISFMRIEASNLLNTEMVRNLPPGIASDRDVEIIQKGFPDPNASPEMMQRYLEAFANLKKAAALKKELQSVFTETTGGMSVARQKGATIRGIEVAMGEEYRSFEKRYFDKLREQEQAKKRELDKANGGVPSMLERPASLGDLDDDELFNF